MPIYFLAIVPTIVIASPEATFSLSTAWVPVVNIALLFRVALQGNLSLEPAAIALSSAVLYATVVLAFAVWYLQRREVVAGNTGRRFSLWPRRRVAS